MLPFYFILIGLMILMMCGFLQSLFHSTRATTKDYFLAGKSMFWLPVGASLFASNIGSEHFIGLAGSGAASGIAVAAFELNALFLLQCLGWIFLPVYLAAGVYTMPEYLRRRYGSNRIQMYVAVLSLLWYILTKISVDLYSGALFIKVAFGWNIYASVGILLLVISIFTVAGGLAAVIYTDTLQAFIMVIGAIVLAVISFNEIGGYKNLEPRYARAVPNETLYGNDTCGLPRDDYFHIFRDPWNSDMPWLGFFIGSLPASLQYWAMDQVIVQRALSAKNLSNAQGGTLFAGYLKILPMFIIVMPGMISRILFPDIVACVDPDVCYEVCQSTVSCSNIAYPTMVVKLLPSGLTGLMLAVMLSALVSSLTSIFNCSSTILTLDIWQKFRPNSTQKEKVLIGRISVVVMVGISILLIPVVASSSNGELFYYIQKISIYIQPPLTVIFCLGIFWERASETGAFYALIASNTISVIRVVLELVYPEPACGEPDTRPEIVEIHYFYIGAIVLVVALLVQVGLSFFTTPMNKDKLHRLTWWTRYDDPSRSDISPLMDNQDTEIVSYGLSIISSTESEEISTQMTPELVIADPTDMTTEETAKTNILRFVKWFCGITDEVEVEEPNKETATDFLDQDPRHKLILNSVLVVLLAVGIFLYAYYG
ncbi:sodium/myo-inositol cotransporter 2-like [Anneissia japonica]|uniref:sodium/myo-inositol cotransporter 2-like n=1 Tax=Anneissia japonica TaxID=1529436 RepID=UPI001425A12D|nr:sodium/myo-inositol cotransporter 2-like [Anneissia japonica]